MCVCVEGGVRFELGGDWLERDEALELGVEDPLVLEGEVGTSEPLGVVGRH